MTNDVVACWTSRNELPTRKRLTVLRYSCSGSFSVSMTYISSWCWLTSTYLNILIWFSIEVLHHALHLQKKRLALKKKYCYIAGNFFPTACALIGYFKVTWHMTSNNETVSRQNLWADNVAKSMTSEGNSARSPANVVLTDDCSYSEV